MQERWKFDTQFSTHQIPVDLMETISNPKFELKLRTHVSTNLNNSNPDGEEALVISLYCIIDKIILTLDRVRVCM